MNGSRPAWHGPRFAIPGLAALFLLAACRGSVGQGGEAGQPGPPGPAAGTLVASVVDEASGGPVAGATVTVEPGGAAAVTDGNGEASFPGLATGLHRVTASAPRLLLAGSAVVPGPPVTATGGWTSVVAGAAVRQALRLPRIDGRINLVAVHSGGASPPPVFSDDNCRACHGDRAAEKAAGSLLPPFHTLMITHGEIGCTRCHRTVDVAQGSGATLNQQVDAMAVCTECHPGYPVSFHPTRL